MNKIVEFLSVNSIAGATLWENLKSGLEKITTGVRSISVAAFILAIVIAGVAWIIGGRSAEFAKSTLGRVLIGVAVVSLAVTIVSTLAATFGGSTGF